MNRIGESVTTMTRSSVLSPRDLSLVCDRIVTGGILFLILFTPLTFGSVHFWALSLMEMVIFLLLMVWMSKLLFSSFSLALSAFRRFSFSPLRSFALPLLLFIGLVLSQMLPLPPTFLRLLSPATYELYTHSLPGWPERAPYEKLSSAAFDDVEARAYPVTTPWVVLPTLEEVRQGVPVSLASTLTSAPQPPTPPVTPQASWSLWRPLSIAPSLTSTALLKLCAYASLFFLVLLYPFGSLSRRDNEQQAVSNGRPHTQEEAAQGFVRVVLLTVLLSGLLIAGIGLLQQVTWNGKILWFFVPYDWGAPNLEGIPRASGPFVNPDHFANYLTLIFPLALVGVLSPSFLGSQERAKACRLFCGLTAFVLLLGILLSLSRGGWAGVAGGMGVLLWTLLSLPDAKRVALLRWSKKSVVCFAVTGFVLLLVLALLFIGSSGRSQMDGRLAETVLRDAGLGVRVTAWQDSLEMIRDFPLVGVGLGTWPELFPRYQRPPWSPVFYREAHNDYLELCAETGLVGCGLLAWVFWQGGRRLIRGLSRLPSQMLPVYAALLAAVGGMAVHELFDFSLQIPANALLFTLLFGIALRLAGAGVQSPKSEVQSPKSKVQGRFQGPIAVGTGATVCVLLLLSLEQARLPYPQNLKEPTSLAEARETLFSHPARSATHLSLFHLLQEKSPLSQRLQELEIALWLDPKNPSVRDLYAQRLLQQGRVEEGLKEITRSVFFSPSLSTHAYLSQRLMPWLSAREQQAVEKGFQQAITSGSEEAVGGLGALYTALGRFAEEGGLYERAALEKAEPIAKTDSLLAAALAYTRAGAPERAEALLRQAIVVTPQRPEPYHYLANWIFVPRKDLGLAKAVISEGIQKGADPFSLSLSLAEATHRFGDNEGTRAALLQALTLRPSSFEAYFRLGLLYLQEENFDRAALVLRKATELAPQSALAFYHLGTAEEGRYQFVAAERAYAQAVALAPDHPGFQQRSAALLRKIADRGKEATEKP